MTETETELAEWRERIGVQVLHAMTCTHDFSGATCETCWDNTQRACRLIEGQVSTALVGIEHQIVAAGDATAGRGFEGAAIVYGAAARIVREHPLFPGDFIELAACDWCAEQVPADELADRECSAEHCDDCAYREGCQPCQRDMQADVR